MHIVTLYLRLIWAKLTGNPVNALLIRKEILMADFSGLSSDIDAVVTKLNNDAAAAAAALTSADTATQGQVDAMRAKLAPVLAPVNPEPAPVDPSPAPAA